MILLPLLFPLLLKVVTREHASSSGLQSGLQRDINKQCHCEMHLNKVYRETIIGNSMQRKFLPCPNANEKIHKHAINQSYILSQRYGM